MKVTLEKDYKDLYTITDLKRAKEIIHQMKEDLSTPEEYLEAAAYEILRSSALKDTAEFFVEVLTAKATTCRNGRVWNAFFDFSSEPDGLTSRDIDVLITGTVKLRFGFLEIEAFLSDIWQIDGNTPVWGSFYAKYYSEATLQP